MTEDDFRSILRDELEPIRTELTTIQGKISGVPLIAVSVHELREDVRELRRETRMIKAAINDMARINITAGEVEALHDELDGIADAQIDIKARLTLLELKSN